MKVNKLTEQEKQLALDKIEELKEIRRKHKELIEQEYKKGNPILRNLYQKQ